MAQNAEQQNELTALFARYNIRIGMLYGKLIKELAKLGYDVESKLSEDTLFLFDNFPELKQRLNDILLQYVQENVLLARRGITEGVALAFGQDAKTLHGYTVLNDDAILRLRKYAINAFTAKRQNSTQGLSLSHRVWNYAEQTKSEFEMAMSNVVTDGLKQGTSASELSRRVRDQLQEPDMMYRRYHHKVITSGGTKKDVVKWHKRIVDDEGHVRFVEAPLEEVGQGVYRSSYKNTFRLMRSEINMSYHYANNVRWQSEPFVIGIRIWGSPQHPKKDICDELWGNYPKDFEFAGFHPQCLCASAAITCSRDEIREYHRRKRAGEDMSNWKPKGYIEDVPDAFKQYVQEHKAQIMAASERGTLGYVFRDNVQYWRNEFDKDEQQQMGIYVEPKKERHVKTEDEKAAIQKRWNEHKLWRAQQAINMAGVNAESPMIKKRLNALRMTISMGNQKGINTAYEKLLHSIDIQKIADERHIKRDAQAIQSTWDARRKQNALIFNTGKNVMAVAQKLDYAETSSSWMQLQDLLLQYKLKEAEQLTKQLAKQIADINKQAAKLQYVQNAKQNLKKVSIAELQGVETSVAGKVVWVETKYPDDYLKHAGKYEWEAYDYFGANMNDVQQKFPNTWQIAQEAYIKLAQQSKETYEWQQLKAQLQTLNAYPATSPKFKQEVADADALVLAKQNLAAAQAAVKVAVLHMKNLESQKKSYNKKHGITGAALGGKLTEKQVIAMSGEFAKLRLQQHKSGEIQLTQEQQETYKLLQKAAKAGNIAQVRDYMKQLGQDLNDPYSDARRELAPFHKTAKQANDYFFGTDVEYWKVSTDEEHSALWGYTAGSAYVTESLRAIPGHYYSNSWKHDVAEIDAHIRRMTEALDKCVQDRDCWVKRDAGDWDMQYVFNFTPAQYRDIVSTAQELHRITERLKDLDSYRDSSGNLSTHMQRDYDMLETEKQSYLSALTAHKGRMGFDASFMSCGSCAETRFTATGAKPVEYQIYCPSGSKWVYAESFSSCGTFGRRWNGTDKPNPTKYSENEVLLQRGNKLRLLEIRWDDKRNVLVVKMELLEQVTQDFDTKSTSGGVYCKMK